jgi:hypothetical protein
MFIFGIPLSFFLPLVVYAWAGLATGVIGVVTFCVPKRRDHHPRWEHAISGLTLSNIERKEKAI